MNRPTVEKFRRLSKKPMVVILDNVRSMHNVGSVFRTADAFAISEIILCGITATPPHREIRKTAIGAEESVKWSYHSSTLEIVSKFKKTHRIVALEQTSGSKALQEFEASEQPLALILGNEVDGVSDDVLEVCDEYIEIPQFGTKHSFNVSVSCGIAIWEIARKQDWLG